MKCKITDLYDMISCCMVVKFRRIKMIPSSVSDMILKVRETHSSKSWYHNTKDRNFDIYLNNNF
jgi:hypothetical protein